MVEKLLKTLELRDSSFYNNNFYGVYYQSILQVSNHLETKGSELNSNKNHQASQTGRFVHLIVTMHIAHDLNNV